ncbi:hypothetical protein AB1Y20_018058 [Prymnesium parvum]|uniref:Hexosyltransferase n=1 Tax=Prymnesium parvum TaxID=97485 RepID=A0AB34JNR5_PRYPA
MASAETAEPLAARGARCVRFYEATERLSRRQPTLDALTALLRPSTSRHPRAAAAAPSARSLAILVGGQAYRGHARGVPSYSPLATRQSVGARRHAQVRAANSLVEQLVTPYEAAGHRVDLYLTVYDSLRPELRAELQALYAPRVVSVTTVNERGSSQLVTLAFTLENFLRQCSESSWSYAAVVVTRFDLYLKQPLAPLLGGNASAIDAFRFLWRENGGHWRHHTDQRVAARTFLIDGGYDWRRTVHRVPDVLIAFPFAYTSCFRSAVRYETIPAAGAPNTTKLITFLHSIIIQLRKALKPKSPLDPPAFRLVFDNFSGDSNPCRATCMLNPIYDILPRADWIVSSNICQHPKDFTYDHVSGTLCCPSPNYCCPNSIVNCSDPNATLFDVFKSGTSETQIKQSWPRGQLRPNKWYLTPESERFIFNVFWNTSRQQHQKRLARRARMCQRRTNRGQNDQEGNACSSP